MIRFHLDEQVDPAIAVGLRQRGVDVSTTQSAGLLAAADTEHVAYAIAERRVIVTHDSDFVRLHDRGEPHDGIAYCAPQSRSAGQIIRHLCLMHDCMADDEMRGRVEYL